MSTPNPATTKWVPLWDTGAAVGGGGGGVGAIPGEIKMWPGAVVPDVEKYGLWVWADGAVYSEATYPEAAAHIHPNWRVGGSPGWRPDPGAGMFRVPDMRGLTPVGMDAMPGQAAGTRAQWVTRGQALVLAGTSGEESHAVTTAEMPAHGHTVNSHSHGGGYHGHGGGWHSHGIQTYGGDPANHAATGIASLSAPFGVGPYTEANWASITAESVVAAEAPGTNNIGGGGQHETMQPSVFVPYIVKLDD